MKTMKPMFEETEYLRNRFVETYLFIEVTVVHFADSDLRRRAFDECASVFCIKDRRWLCEVWNTINSDLLFLADNTVDFNLLYRISEFYPERFPPDLHTLLKLKKVAMTKKQELLSRCNLSSAESSLAAIESKANGGNTDCSALLAFLLHNGFLVRKNRKSALSRISRLSGWNHFFGTLLGMRYDNENRDNSHAGVLAAILNSPSKSDTLDYLKQELSLGNTVFAGAIPTALENAFDKAVFDRNVLNNDVFQMQLSTALDNDIKCRILESLKNKEAIFGDIPLGVTEDRDISANSAAFETFVEFRPDEVKRIAVNLSLIDIRNTESYRPLLLVCEDELVMPLYRKAFESCFANNRIITVDLLLHGSIDLSPTKSNMFVAAMNKTHERNTILFIENCDSMKADTAQEFADFLRGDSREFFKLKGFIDIPLSLSGVLPVLFARKMPAKAICNRCDVLTIAELLPSEIDYALAEALEARKKLFRVKSIVIEEAAKALLSEYPSDKIAEVIDRAVGTVRRNTKDVVITAGLISGIIRDNESLTHNNSFWRESKNVG